MTSTPTPACPATCTRLCRDCARTCHDCGTYHQVRPFGPRTPWVCIGCTKVSPEKQAEAKQAMIDSLNETAVKERA